jgi:hypothetical protein
MQSILHPPSQIAADVPIEKVPPLYDGRRAALSLNIVVVGAGLGGLAATHSLAQAGHRVMLLESAPRLGDVGAGIQVSPNVSRLLIRWGLGSALGATAVQPEAIVFRRYDTGERVGYSHWGNDLIPEHGAPYYHIHRADYHTLLLRLARAAPGVHIRLGAAVRDAQPDPTVEGGPSVTLASGEVIYADVIIAADGVKSTLQKIVTGRNDNPMPTGDAAYRATIPTDLMLRDPELRPFVETPEMTAWMAPGRHLMAYCIVRAHLSILGKQGFGKLLIICYFSARKRSTTWCCSTQTTGPSNHGRRRAVATRCAQTLRTLSHGESTALLTTDDPTCSSCFQRPKTLELRQVDSQMAPHGPHAPANLGASERPLSALGRLVPSNACTLSFCVYRVAYS